MLRQIHKRGAARNLSASACDEGAPGHHGILSAAHSQIVLGEEKERENKGATILTFGGYGSRVLLLNRCFHFKLNRNSNRDVEQELGEGLVI